MAIYGKELRKANTRKFMYTMLDKEYIVEAETKYNDFYNGDLYEFFLHRVGCGMKSHIFGFPADQTKAKIDPKYYTLEDALELVESNLFDNILFYEKEINCLEGMDYEAES